MPESSPRTLTGLNYNDELCAGNCGNMVKFVPRSGNVWAAGYCAPALSVGIAETTARQGCFREKRLFVVKNVYLL